MSLNNLDQVTLVNESDQVIGAQDKVEAHRAKGQLHRAVSVFLFNGQGELLIQKRSQEKIVASGLWANTACGNVRPNESYLECALRRLREELGITGVDLTKMGKFQYHVQFDNGFSERELDTVFAGFFDGNAQLNPQEVSEIAWINFSQLQTDTRNYAHWLPLIAQQEEIQQKLESYAASLNRSKQCQK